MVHDNSRKLSKMLINGTSLLLPHLSVTGSKFKDTLLHVLCIKGALPHLLYPPIEVINLGIWLNPSFVYFHGFCIPEVSVKWIAIGEISVAIKFSNMNFFAHNCLTFF